MGRPDVWRSPTSPPNIRTAHTVRITLPRSRPIMPVHHTIDYIEFTVRDLAEAEG
ncbi:MAG: hypothetical protein R6U63_14510 [Longimicrobiales bacterium]